MIEEGRSGRRGREKRPRTEKGREGARRKGYPPFAARRKREGKRARQCGTTGGGRVTQRDNVKRERRTGTRELRGGRGELVVGVTPAGND